MTPRAATDRRAAFEEHGYVAPVPVLGADELEPLARGALAAAARTRRRKGIHREERSILALARSSPVLELVTSLIGDEVLLWGSSVFEKRPRDERRVAWHQDAVAWPLNPDDTVTVWVSLDGSDVDNGAVEVIDGSHRLGRLGHGVDTRPGNVLDRNLALDVTDLPGAVVPLVLAPGEASAHHARLVHGSPPNPSPTRPRTGIALRYMPPAVRVVDPERWHDFEAIPMTSCSSGPAA